MNIKNMSTIEVISKTNLILPTYELMQCITDESVKPQALEEIRNIDSIDEAMSFLIRYDKYIDKARLTFINYLYATRELPIEFIDDNETVADINVMKDIMKDNPCVYINFNTKTFEVKIYNSKDYASDEQKKERISEIKEGKHRFSEIDKELEIEFFTGIQILSDFALYATDEELAELFRDITIIKTHQAAGEKDKQKLMNFVRGDEKSDVDFREYLPHFRKILKDNAEYIDWDKFLLLSAKRASNILEGVLKKPIPEINQKMLIELMKISNDRIRNRKCKISGEMELYDGSRKKIKYSVIDLEKDIENKIINGQYYGKERLEQLKQQLLNGEVEMKDIDSKVLELIHLIPAEKNELIMHNQENAIDLYKRGMLSSKQIQSMLKNIILNENTLKELTQIDPMPIDTDGLIQLYLEGNIYLEDLIKIKDTVENNITEQKLIEQFKQRNDEDSKEISEKYMALYREAKLTDEDENTRTELGEKIILELGNEMEEEDFIELYRRNLITIDNLIGWNGENFVTKMLTRGQLKPVDSKKLIAEHKIDLKEIKDMLMQKSLSDEEKISFIITTFDGEENADIRYELFQTLEVSENARDYNDTYGNGRKKSKGGTVQSNIYEVDPSLKMSLLLKIDKDYTYTISRDGHMILELPKLNKVIIEKLFQRSKNKVEFATGTATYILDLDRLHIFDIITGDNKINRHELHELYESKDADRLYHAKNWGKAVKEAFNIEHSSRYSSEDREEIDRVIQQIERNRRLRDF